jgi:hypothetical protein
VGLTARDGSIPSSGTNVWDSKGESMACLLATVVMIVGSLLQAPQPTPAPSSETATQFYLRYRAAVATATSVDDVLTFWSTDAANEYKSAPPDQRVDLALIKRMNGMVSGVTVTREVVSTGPGSTDAILSLEGIGRDQNKVTGTARLVKNEGAWKLAEPEHWK